MAGGSINQTRVYRIGRRGWLSRIVCPSCIVGGALLALVAQAVQALGIGAIDVESRLGEPFRAEVPITNISAAELQSLLVGPANQGDFQRAGLAEKLPPVHLKFETERRADGTAIINVTSAQSVVEPTFDFLLAVQWDGGRLVREYTALLNPGPVRLASAALPAAAVARNTAAVAAAPKIPLDGRYTVRKGDSLWRIAHAISKKNRMPLQTLMAGIAAANPRAFGNHDINFLKRGAELRIPAVGELFAPAKVVAAASPVAKSTASRPSGSATAALDATSSSPAGPGETTANVPPSATEPAGGLRIRGAAESAASGTQAQSGTGAMGGAMQVEMDDLEGRIATLEEQLLSKGLENNDLRARVQALEQQIKRNGKLLTLNQPGLATVSPAPVVKPSRPEGGGVTTAPPPEAADTAARSESRHALSDTEISHSRLAPSRITDILALLAPTRIFAVLATLLLGIAALFFVRHRRAADPDYFELAADDTVMAPDSASSEAAGGAATPVVSPAVPQTAAEPGGVPLDPLAEADVLLAYGRLPQARQVLERAVCAGPRDTGLRLKLLEVVCQQGDTSQFELLARSFQAEFAVSHPKEWQRVMAMGRSLAPDDPLFVADRSRVSENEVVTTPPPAGDDDMRVPEPVESSADDELSAGSPADAPSPDAVVSNTVEWDSLSTRLDLARAYIEISDHEAARKLLDAVQRDGSAEQRQTAERLAERLPPDSTKPGSTDT